MDENEFLAQQFNDNIVKAKLYDENNVFEKSLEHYLNAEKILRTLLEDELNHPEFVGLYENIYSLYEDLQQYNNAFKYAMKLKDIIEVMYDSKHFELAFLYKKISFYSYHLKQYEFGITYILQSKEIFDILLSDDKYHIEYISIFNLMTLLYKDAGNIQLALDSALILRDNIEYLYKDNFDNVEFASVYNNISVLYQELGNFNEAVQYAMKDKEVSEKIFKDNPNHESLAYTYNNLGLLYNDIGDLENAFSYIQLAVNIMSTLTDKNFDIKNLAASLDHLGQIYLSFGKLDQALESSLKSLKIRERININDAAGADLVLSYNNISAIYRKQHNLDLAKEFCLNSKNILEKIYIGKTIPNTFFPIYENLGLIYHELAVNNQNIKMIEIAIEFMGKAIKMKEERFDGNKKHPSTITSYNNIALLYKSFGKYEIAEKYYLEAQRIQEKIYEFNSNHPDLALSCNNLGQVYEAIGEIEKYYLNVTKAYEIYTYNRKTSFNYLNQKQKFEHNISNKSYLKHFFDSSHLYIQELKDDNDKIQEIKETIFNAWLQYKGSISDFENIITILYNQTEDKKIKEFIEKREELRKRLSALYHTTEIDEKKLEIQRKITKEIEDEISEIENYLAKESTLLSAELSLEEVSYKDLAPYLKEDDFYVDYAYIGTNYYIFTLNHEEEIEFILIDEKKSKEIDANAKSYMEDIKALIERNANEDYRISKDDLESNQEILSKLYELVIKDYPFFSDKQRFIISPDGLLGYIPFEALYNEGKYLIENKSIAYVPSGKEFARLIRHKANDSEDVVVFANPNFNGDIEVPVVEEYKKGGIRSLGDRCELGDQKFNPLDYTQEELNAIKTKFLDEELKEYSHDEATKTTFLEVSDAKILHCATHAFYLNCPTTENPLLKVGIAFSGANMIVEDDKREQTYRPHIATGLELASMKLQGTDIVVLSACQSATGDSANSEGIMGLNKAFIQAGSKSVVASLWEVDDQQTAIFFEHTYQLISDELNDDNENIDYSEVVRQTKREFIKENKPPYFWAAFTFFGI